MTEKHDDLYTSAIVAISALFGDQSVPQSQTRESLNSLKGGIDVMLDSLEDE